MARLPQSEKMKPFKYVSIAPGMVEQRSIRAAASDGKTSRGFLGFMYLSYSALAPVSSAEARISTTHTLTSAMPRGYSLKRAMASMRRAIFFAPLEMELVPGARA